MFFYQSHFTVYSYGNCVRGWISCFFCQMQIGKNGKPLKMIKLRSMQKNAESLPTELSKAERREFAKNYKLKKDPRITRIGRFIWQICFDELPLFADANLAECHGSNIYHIQLNDADTDNKGKR